MEATSHSSGRGTSQGTPGPDANYDIPDSGRSYSPSKQRSYDSDESAREHINFYYDSPSKRCKNDKRSRTKEKHSDRISTLPDSVLCHILSFLPMKDAVKTGVLSKRWTYMWTYITNLVYHHGDPLSYHDEFIDFVNRTLVLHDSSKIKRFVINFGYETGSDYHVDLWVRVATRKGVEELRLDFDGDDDHYLLPQHLYTNSSLTELSSKFCDFAPSGRVCWTSLKILSIGQAKLSDDAFRTILLGSPVLEYLKLQDCEGFNRLDITSQSLRKFVIDNYYGGDDSVLEILGPNLRSLEISGFLYTRKCRLMNVSSLVDASLNFYMEMLSENREISNEEHRNMLRELLEILSYVKELTIGSWCIQLLSTWEVKFLPSPLSKRKCLILKTQLHRWDFPGIASLLESSPDLEKLVINMTSPDEDIQFAFESFDPEFLDSYDFNEEKYWTSQKRIFKCLLLHLKTVEILGFVTGRYGVSEQWVALLVEFLLKNAKVLEKLVIYKQKVNRPWVSQRPQKLLEVAQKLLSFPRSSPDAVVLFS